MERKFYVSADAVSGGDGSIEKPFSTLEEARDAIRVLRSEGKISAEDAVTVLLRGGEYCQTHMFELDERDSGTEKAPVTFKAYEDEKVYISGARTLKPEKFYKPSADVMEPIAKKYPDAVEHIVAYDLKAEGLSYEGESQIYWNGNRGILARYPNEPYHYMEGVEQLPCEEDRRWRYTFKDLDNIVQTWRSFEGVRIIGNFYLDWASTDGYIIGCDPEKGTITIDCNGEARDTGRYYFSNIFEELNTPGEYYIDKKNGILYFYCDGDIAQMQIQMRQCAEGVISVKADYITIEGCTIECGNEVTVVFDGTGLTLRGCTVRRTYKTGLRFDGYKGLISHCEFYTIGGDGIDMGGGDAKKLLPSESEISDTVFHDFGEVFRVYNGGVFLRGRGIRCIHNEFYNAPHLAMSVSGSELDIRYNCIHHVCYEANDAGAVYLGGWAPQDIIFDHNIIRDVKNIYGTGYPNGYYNDDGGGGKTIRSNLFININGNAFAMGGGRDNIIEDNIMVNTRLSYDERLYYDQWEMHNAVYQTGGLWGNLLRDPGYGTKEWALRYPRTMLIKATNVRDYNSRFVPYAFGHTVVRNNVTYHQGGYKMDALPDTRRLSNFRDNIQYDSLEDIGFVDFENGDYRLKPESKVFHDLPGFAECEFSMIGVR